MRINEDDLQGVVKRNTTRPRESGPRDHGDCHCLCLCKGAVDTLGWFPFELDDQLTFPLWASFRLLGATDAGCASGADLAERPPPGRLDSGRTIRLLLASLLL
jgi:hypothetical protein